MTSSTSSRAVLAVAGLVAFLGLGSGSANAAVEATVIEFTQTACQFLESENGIDHSFTTNAKSDCIEINRQTGEQRLASAKVLKLKPGKYVFRVTNENVPYDLGFWLRGEGLLGRVMLPSVSGGGLSTGITLDYEVELVEGEYLYSCPLNPTPDYHLIVES